MQAPTAFHFDYGCDFNPPSYQQFAGGYEQFLAKSEDFDPMPCGIDIGSPFTASSPSSSGDDDCGTPLHFEGLYLSPQPSLHQLPSLQSSPQSSPSPQPQPTLTVAPSDLSRPVSPSVSDATPPPTIYLPAVRAARQSHSSLNDPDAEGDCDDNDKDADYKPESDSEPAFSSSSNRKRRFSVDEYTPEIVKKKPRSSGPARRPTPKNAIKLPSAKLAQAGHSVKRTRVSPPPRNAQVDSTTAKSIVALLNIEKKKSVTTWQCPGCTLYQYNHRFPDFKRHMITHLGKVVQCIGVPLSEAEQYGISPNAERTTYEGEQRVGGCEKFFSRPDAYKRHLTNHNNDCVAARKRGRAH
ncbi:hypothetical protein BJ912DRAFT_1056722 [Pholiota molesta]|nr:hypothetical protein BJ912DRAFT_1056722 [Pholiota molesta]